MKRYLILLLGVLLAACAEETASDKTAGVKTGADSAASAATKPVICERTNGLSNVRDTINGNLLFTLNDNTPVTCTRLENGWYRVGVSMEIDTGEFSIGKLRKGRKILVEGKEVGEVMADVDVSTSATDKEAWAELVGYTQEKNIRPESIIEPVLSNFLTTIGSDRSFAALRPMVHMFRLQRYDGFEGYRLFVKDENWIDDPSPMWRIAIVFRDEKLVGFIHSRPLQVKGATDHRLDRGLGCLIYNDVPDAEKIAGMFNRFVNSVD